MKLYHYFLFSIYSFYEKYEKTGLLFSTSIVITVFISINIITIYIALDYLDVINFDTNFNKIQIAIFMFLIWLANYYFGVRKKKFLEQNFHRDVVKDTIIVGYIILTIISIIWIGNLNRAKIFNSRNNIEIKTS